MSVFSAFKIAQVVPCRATHHKDIYFHVRKISEGVGEEEKDAVRTFNLKGAICNIISIF